MKAAPSFAEPPSFTLLVWSVSKGDPVIRNTSCNLSIRGNYFKRYKKRKERLHEKSKYDVDDPANLVFFFILILSLVFDYS